nr:replication factor a protein 3 [Quercus suber]
MADVTPRITAPYLQQFSHQTVRILGKVKQVRGEEATIDAGGQIALYLSRLTEPDWGAGGKQDAHLQVNHAVEIIGKVQNNLSVKVMASTDMGPESGMDVLIADRLVQIDFDAVSAVVDATHRYAEIFYNKE